MQALHKSKAHTQMIATPMYNKQQPTIPANIIDNLLEMLDRMSQTLTIV